MTASLHTFGNGGVVLDGEELSLGHLGLAAVVGNRTKHGHSGEDVILELHDLRRQFVSVSADRRNKKISFHTLPETHAISTWPEVAVKPVDEMGMAE